MKSKLLAAGCQEGETLEQCIARSKSKGGGSCPTSGDPLREEFFSFMSPFSTDTQKLGAIYAEGLKLALKKKSEHSSEINSMYAQMRESLKEGCKEMEGHDKIPEDKLSGASEKQRAMANELFAFGKKLCAVVN